MGAEIYEHLRNKRNLKFVRKSRIGKQRKISEELPFTPQTTPLPSP